MSDKLEDFIRSNRNAFDDKEPPEKVWKAVEGDLFAAPARPWYDSLLLWRVAAVVLLGACIYLAVPRSTASPDSSKVAVNEFNDVEAFYTTQISQKVALIEEFSGGTSHNEFAGDFQQLEAMYNVLKEEWKARPSRKVKDALVLNLLVRINLLNQQLQRLEDQLKDDAEEEGPAAES